MASRSLFLQGVAAGIAFLPVAWGKAWAVMIIAALALAVVCGAGGLVAHGPWGFWSRLAALASLIVADGALYALALRLAGEARDARTTLGGATWRLSAVLALTLLFLGILGLLAFVVILVFAFAVASSGQGFVLAHPMSWAGAVDGRGKAVVVAVSTLCLVGLTWAGLRLSLAPAASVATGKVQVLATWPQTRRLIGSIVAGRLLLGAAPVLVVVAGLRAAASWATGDPLAASVAALLVGVTLAGAWLPLNAGFMAYLYRSRPAQ